MLQKQQKILKNPFQRIKKEVKLSTKILIVEDEEKMARMLELELLHEGYEVTKTYDGKSGLEEAETGKYDLVLLDIMLPSLSGMEVLRRLRKKSEVPVILLTARGDTIDKVAGLDSGANDYITKPFEIEEVFARIRACLRENLQVKGKELTAMGVTLNPESHEVSVENVPVELTHKEFELLECLLENKGKVLTREVLLDKVWGYDFMGDTNSVDVYIRFLRAKIDQNFGIKLIHTIRGTGYMIRG